MITKSEHNGITIGMLAINGWTRRVIFQIGTILPCAPKWEEASKLDISANNDWTWTDDVSWHNMPYLQILSVGFGTWTWHPWGAQIQTLASSASPVRAMSSQTAPSFEGRAGQAGRADGFAAPQMLMQPVQPMQPVQSMQPMQPSCGPKGCTASPTPMMSRVPWPTKCAWMGSWWLNLLHECWTIVFKGSPYTPQDWDCLWKTVHCKFTKESLPFAPLNYCVSSIEEKEVGPQKNLDRVWWINGFPRHLYGCVWLVEAPWRL